MTEAVCGHSADCLPLSCGEMPTGSTTRRALFGLAGGAALALAAPADGSAAEPALALFAEWVDTLHHKLPHGLSQARQERAWARIADRQMAILDQLRQLPPSHAQMCAVIWISAHDVHGSVDPANPALPGDWTPEMRTVVEYAARLEPRLATIADIK